MATSFLPILPPVADLPILQSVGVYVFGNGALPARWLGALNQVNRGGVVLYEIYACEDALTRERILFGQDGVTLWSIPAPSGYNPANTVHAYWPWLANLPEDDPDRLWYEAVYDPARVISLFLLLPELSADDFAEVLEAERAQAEVSAALARSFSVNADAFFVTSIVRTNATSVTLTLQFPPGFTNRVDLFGIGSLTSFPWQLLATMEPVTSQTAEVTLAWDDAAGFFRAGDADTDSDGDGVPDARERLLHGTDPSEEDTDGDGMPDGWELGHGLDPLAVDARGDPDGDGLPAVYEYWHGTNPTNADSHLVAKLRVDPVAAITNVSFYASIRAAFVASAPYSVIEVADGVHAGQDNAGFWFPDHPILLMSENWGTSRQATISHGGNLAAFYLSEYHDNRTIVRGLNLALDGRNTYQIGFWLGDGAVIAPGMGAAPVFEGVTIRLGVSDISVGFFCRHSALSTVHFENCVIRGKRGVFKPRRGIYAIDSPALRLVNCTFQDFSPEPYSYGIQLESTPNNYGAADNPVDVDIVNCVWDESFDHANVHAFVRLQNSVVYDVGMTNCLVPRVLDWFPPDACSGLLVTNAHLAIGGHLRSGSPAINAGFATGAPPRDFEGQMRDAFPDIGADEYGGFAVGDSDGDGISDAVEVETYGTNPYATDSDDDGLDDGTEVALGSDPANPFSFRVTVLGSVTNRTGASAPVRACYGWSEGVWHAATATNVAADGTFIFDVFPDTVHSGVWVNVFCDFNTNGIVDIGTEPVYSQAVIVTGAYHRMHFDLRDWDGDGVSDWDEAQCGTDPLAETNYCVTILGEVTNALPFAWNLRAGVSLTADGTGMLAETNAVPVGGFALPHVRVSAAGTLRVHLYDDFNSNAVLDAGEAFITQTPTVTGAVLDVGFVVSEETCDKDADGMPDFWEVRHGLSWTNAADACANPDGDGLINLHEYWCGTDLQMPDGAQCALSDAALAIDSRITGKNPTNALPLFENYLPNGTNGVFIRNADCWAADLDLTCCSPWNSHAAGDWHQWHGAGTLISPRHILFAAHYEPPVNCFLYFVDRHNNVITRKLKAKKHHPHYVGPPTYAYDITIGVLDADVPTNRISFARVLPDNYADYIRTGARLPTIRLDQEEKALVGDLAQVGNNTLSCIVPVDATRLDFFEDIIRFDSGNPVFILINGQPILLTVWTRGGPGIGTSVTAFKADINQLMSDLGGGYQLTEVDLTGFTPLP